MNVVESLIVDLIGHDQDTFMDRIRDTAELIEWNFGDVEEEAQAFQSGNSTKVAKISKKLQTQRLLINLAKIDSEEKKSKLCFPFLGHVSTIKSPTSIPICKMFGCVFYMNAPPTPSPTSSIAMPAWLAGSTTKTASATMMEKLHTHQCVASLQLEET